MRPQRRDRLGHRGGARRDRLHRQAARDAPGARREPPRLAARALGRDHGALHRAVGARRYGYGWPGRVEDLPLQFERAGLKDVRLRGFLSTFSTSDETYSRDERRRFLEGIGRHELDSIGDLWRSWSDVYTRHGVSNDDRLELQEIAAREHALRLRDFDDGHHV